MRQEETTVARRPVRASEGPTVRPKGRPCARRAVRAPEGPSVRPKGRPCARRAVRASEGPSVHPKGRPCIRRGVRATEGQSDGPSALSGGPKPHPDVRGFRGDLTRPYGRKGIIRGVGGRISGVRRAFAGGPRRPLIPSMRYCQGFQPVLPRAMEVVLEIREGLGSPSVRADPDVLRYERQVQAYRPKTVCQNGYLTLMSMPNYRAATGTA
jgi:hypothetical protein